MRRLDYLRPRNQLAASSTTPRPPASMPCLARIRIRPVSCPGKNVGSESAGTRKYIAATINRTTPRMVTMAFMLEPPLPADHSKAAPSLSSPVWLFEFNGSDVMRRVFSHHGLPWPPPICPEQHEPNSASPPPNKISYPPPRSSNPYRTPPPPRPKRIRRPPPPVPQKRDARPTHSAS